MFKFFAGIAQFISTAVNFIVDFFVSLITIITSLGNMVVGATIVGVIIVGTIGSVAIVTRRINRDDDRLHR